MHDDGSAMRWPGRAGPTGTDLAATSTNRRAAARREEESVFAFFPAGKKGIPAFGFGLGLAMYETDLHPNEGK
jgi:hypothetical protein